MQNTPRVTINTPIVFRDDLPESVDVVIIGGGVIGVFTALYLARMGKRVFLCEKGRIAGEQSSRNWGWIRQQGRDAAELPIMMQSLQLWKDVDNEVNGQCGVTTCGTYYLETTQKALAKHDSFLQIACEHGVDTRPLSRKEIETAFGGKSNHNWIGGIATPSDMRGEPWRAVPAVAKLAHEAGALMRENCAVRALDIEAGRVTGVITEHGRIKCAQVVLATGAWSSLFARRHGVNIPQLAVHSTVAQTAPIPEFFSGAAADEKLALRRRDDGGYTLSPADHHAFFLGPDAFRHFRKYLPAFSQSWKATNLKLKAPTGFPDAWGGKRTWAETETSPFEITRVLEPAPDLKRVSLLQDYFDARFPEIGRPEIKSAWAGMIDAMPDIVPIVDHVATLPGLIMATGMSGHGFGIGPGFGQIIANMVAGNKIAFDMKRFRFNRFTDGSKLELGGSL
jgi:glycine/D-amino acid oxidase-like deaminating enzyme